MFKSIFTNSFGILFSRIFGFIRDLLTASILGANIYSDIFFIAFKLPNLFRRIFAEGAFTQSFIPAFTLSRHKAIFSVHIFMLFIFIIMLITMMVNLFPHASAKAIALGFDAQTIELASPYVAINFFYLPIIFAVTFFSTFLQYKHHFATTAFATGLLNISLIIALLLSQGKSDDIIVTYLSYGVVLGGLLQLAVHVIAIYRIGLAPLLIGGLKHYKRKYILIKNESREFSKQFFPAIWCNSTAQFSAFLDTWLASFLATGVISYLYYANRVFQLPLALFAIATSVALFPRIARYIRHDKEEEALKFMKKAFWFLAFLLMASTIGGFILSHEITQLLFERGAFDTLDTNNTALILQMYMVGLLPFGINKLLVLWLYAQNRQMQAAKIATLSLSVNIIFSLLLISPLGGAGLALASTISGFVAFIATVLAFGKDKFLAIISQKYALLWLLSTFIFTIIVLFIKEMIHVYL